MKLIHSIPSLIPEGGGPSRSVTSLCSALGELGNEIHLISLDVGPKFAPPLLPSNKQVQTIFVRNRLAFGLRQLWAPAFAQRLVRLVDTAHAELIHDHCIWLPTNAAAAEVAQRKNLPFVVSLRGMLEPWALQQGRRHKQLAWWLYQERNLRKAQLLHATSESEAENLRQIGLHQPIAVVPNGVIIPEINRNNHQPKKATIRTLLFMSRIHPKKGLLNLVEALKTIDLTNWQVVIAGPDENNHQYEVEEMIKLCGLQKKFTFIGPINDQAKWNIYQEADLFVLPTFSENFGIVVVEALGAGIPVITTKGAPWQELESYNCGWWVEIGIKPLQDALRHAMSLSDDELQQMGENGRQLVEKKYSWHHVSRQMSAAYQWLLGNRTRPEFVW